MSAKHSLHGTGSSCLTDRQLNGECNSCGQVLGGCGDTPRVGLERERLGKHPTQTTHHPRGSERMQGSPILEHDRLRPIPNGAGSVLFDTEGFDNDSMDFVGERRGFDDDRVTSMAR